MPRTSARKSLRISQTPSEQLLENQHAITNLLRRLEYLHDDRERILKDMHECHGIDMRTTKNSPSEAETSTTA